VEQPSLQLHSRAALQMTEAAAAGRFELQKCQQCGAVQYPPRDACHRCLSIDLQWTLQPGAGRLISETTLFHSHLPQFNDQLPLRIGLVQLQCGPIALAFLEKTVPSAPADVEVTTKIDPRGYAVLVAR
jgi:uncharacterized OB-fold protein